MIITVTLNAAIDKRYVVDGFRPGEVNRVRECRYTPGGKGLNVARTAAIAGMRVAATGFVGGFAGRYIEEALKPYGIESRFCHLAGESRSCVNLWDSVNETQTELLEPGFSVEPEEFERFSALYDGLVKDADVIVLSGSLPAGLDSGSYSRLIRQGKDQGKKVILDTSKEALKFGIQAAPYLVKPNLDEIRALTGMACSELLELIQAARWILSQGVETAVISLGADGSLLVNHQGAWRARVPRIQTVNTVGCGDAMTAGFAIGISRYLETEELLRTASAVSTAAAMTEETGSFEEEDFRKIYSQIEIEALAC